MYNNNILNDIKNIQTVYIAGHFNPDGDAVGACFAFALAMAKLGKNPVVLLDKYADKFNMLNGSQYVYGGEYSKLEPEIFFSIDCGDKDRLGRALPVFEKAKTKYNIDHHISNNNFGDYNIVNAKASSASEIVYEILSKITDIDKDIASAIYSGILFDTGGFMHNCTSKRTHQIAGELVEKGIDTPFIHSKILKEHTLTQVRVFNKALENLVVENCIAFTKLTDAEIKGCGADPSDLDGIVEYVLNIDGVRVSMLATERNENMVKLSFRSRTIDVNSVAALFGGGGHILAAGAGVKDRELNDVVNEAFNELKARLVAYEKY